MKPGINPKIDYAFKWLFGKEVHVALLLDLLNAVLKLPPGRIIESVQLLNPFNDKAVFDGKLSIVDIRAKDQLGSQYNIEMQMRGSRALPRRLLYYWAVLYAGQLQEGDKYTKLRPTITICFLNTVLFAGVTDYHLRFELRSERHPHLIFCDQQVIHMVELPKFKKTADELLDAMDLWCYFLIHGETLDTDNLPEAMRQTIVGKAMEELVMFAQNETERQRYLDRVRAERDELSLRDELLEEGLEEGLEKGEIIGRIRHCQNLLKQTSTPRAELAILSLGDLQAMAEKLDRQLLQVMGIAKTDVAS